MPKAKTDTQKRNDCYIQNDSGGFSILSGAALDRAIADARMHDHQMAMDHQVILLMLEGDDSFPCRVVVGGELTGQEDREWMAKVTWPLEITDGRVIVAGGFDPDVLQDFVDGDGAFEDGVHAFDVPNGKWLVDVYTHRPTISGRFLDEGWTEKLGTWFRREHPGKPFPAWMARELQLSPELDPGYEEVWQDIRGAVADGRLSIDADANSAIGYLVHLRPFQAQEQLSTLPGDGWFGSDTGLREPLACPTGLLTNVLSDEVDDVILAARGEDEEQIGRDGELFDVHAILGEGKWTKITGNPLALPLAELDVAYLIAWLASTYSHPEVRIEVTAGPDGTAQLPKPENWAPPTQEGNAWVYRVPASGVPIGNKNAMQRLALAFAGNTSICQLELSTAIPEELIDEDRGTEEGTARIRLRGAVKNGTWFIDAAIPAVKSDVLADALHLCRQVLDGKSVELRGHAEAAAFDAMAEDLDYLINGAIVSKGSKRTLPNQDSDALGFYVAPVFRLRFGAVWECALPVPEDDEDDD